MLCYDWHVVYVPSNMRKSLLVGGRYNVGGIRIYLTVIILIDLTLEPSTNNSSSK